MNLARVEAARTYLGVKYRHQGRSRFSLDCAGLLWIVERDLGRDPPDIRGYGRTPWKNGLRTEIEAYFGHPINRDPEPGDILLMKHSCEEPEHLGIVGTHPNGVLSLIHSYAGNSARRVVEVRLCDDWRRKILSVYA